jgi:hypothetical protein
MTTVKEAIKHLQTYKPNDVIALIVWGVEDVKERAKERKIKITTAEAKEIVERLEEKHDASIGVSWNTIDCYLAAKNLLGELMRDKVTLKCGCELERTGFDWYVVTLCKKHVNKYYKDPDKIRGELRSQIRKVRRERPKHMLVLVCPKLHVTEISSGSKIQCSKCSFKPKISWDGKSHWLVIPV